MLRTIVATTLISLGVIACSNADFSSTETSGEVKLPKIEAENQMQDQSGNSSSVLSDRQKADIKRLQERFNISEEEARNMLFSIEERADDLGDLKAERIKAAKEKVRAMREAEGIELEESLPENSEP